MIKGNNIVREVIFMNKKFNKILFGFVAMFAFVGLAHAQDSASMKCDKTNLKPGESTICTVTGKTSQTALTSFAANIENSKYLKITNVNANTGWSIDAANTKITEKADKTGQTGVYSFTYSGTVTPDTEMQIFSFTLTLLEEAKNLPDGQCGDICFAHAFFNTTGGDAVASPVCMTPVITVEECTEADCPTPDTGAFMNYAVIAGVSLVALIAILAVNKNKKFYRI